MRALKRLDSARELGDAFLRASGSLVRRHSVSKLFQLGPNREQLLEDRGTALWLWWHGSVAAYVRSAPRHRDQQPFALQFAESLLHGHLRHVVLGRQCPQRWEPLARGEVALGDALAQVVGDLLAERAGVFWADRHIPIVGGAVKAH